MSYCANGRGKVSRPLPTSRARASLRSRQGLIWEPGAGMLASRERAARQGAAVHLGAPLWGNGQQSKTPRSGEQELHPQLALGRGNFLLTSQIGGSDSAEQQEANRGEEGRGSLGRILRDFPSRRRKRHRSSAWLPSPPRNS